MCTTASADGGKKSISQRDSAEAIGLPWSFRERDVFSTDFYILEHDRFLENLRHFFNNVFPHFYANNY